MTVNARTEKMLKLRKLKLLQEKEKKESQLPHIYGWPWYKWAYEFYTHTEKKVQLLCAANQISKSSTQIRKCIHWATDTSLWPKLWGRKPNIFWYLYPSQEVATIEFEKKWIPEFLPNEEMKDDIIYGWKAEYDKKRINALHFNSGVSVYFKTYSQNAITLQTGSVFAIFCDEELPEDKYDELQFRLAGTDGYFHMVFTATLGQEMWWRAMECVGQSQEFLKNAWKKSISMYDCLVYKDGSKAPWTVKRIKDVEQKCKSKAEIQRRVHGRFVKESGRKYHAFDPSKHYVKPIKIPGDYQYYSAVDVGSGGETGHPSAILFLAVSPDMQKGYVVDSWRGDGIPTTSGDVYEKYLELSKGYVLTKQVYDWAAKDFGTIATRLGSSFEKAEKSHELGEGIVNTLFKNDMLLLFDTDENRKLGAELLNLQRSTPKNKAKDDLADVLRYSCTGVNWDLSEIKARVNGNEVDTTPKFPKTKEQWQEYHLNERRKRFYDPTRDRKEDDTWGFQSEIDEWNEMAGN